MNEGYVTLARILRPRGRIGEVAAEILTDFPEQLTRLREVWLWNGRGEPQRVGLRRCWLSTSRGGQAIFHFDGVETIGAAEKLRGCEVQVPLRQRVGLSAGQYFISDLLGCEVYEASEFLGVVREFQSTSEERGGTPLLVVDTTRGELLIPFAAEICVRIDVTSRRIEVRLPEGLRELNA